MRILSSISLPGIKYSKTTVFTLKLFLVENSDAPRRNHDGLDHFIVTTLLKSKLDGLAGDAQLKFTSNGTQFL